MKGIRRFVGVALAMGWLIGAAPTAPDDAPDAYRIQAPIVLGEGSTVQRLILPAAVLAASRTADLSDVRVFDATNRAMPIARAAPAAGPARRHELRAMPILGAADALNVTGVSLRIDGSGGARVAQVVGTPASGPTTATILGVLLDARAITGSASSLSVTAAMPDAQPVTFTVEASDDLKDWRPLAEHVVYRAAGGDGGAAIALPLGGAALGSADLGGDYLRITWRAASRLLSPVTVRQAVLLTRPDAAAGVSIAAILPPIVDPHDVEFALPFAIPLDTIRVSPTGNDMIVPIRILGRDDAEHPWALLGEGTATRPGGANAARDIMLGGGPHRLLRIEVDRRSGGFTSPPTVALGFGPRAIVFLAAGRAPFTLAAGRAAANDVYLPLDSLMTQAAGTSIPTATVTTPDTALRLAAVNDAGGTRRRTLLWIVLLAATLLLAAMAWALWRRGMGGHEDGARPENVP